MGIGCLHPVEKCDLGTDYQAFANKENKRNRD